MSEYNADYANVDIKAQISRMEMKHGKRGGCEGN